MPCDLNHKAKCQAIVQACRGCSKLKHYEKVYRLNKEKGPQRAKEIENDENDQISEDVSHITLNAKTQSNV